MRCKRPGILKAYYQNSEIHNEAYSYRACENQAIKPHYKLCYKLKYVHLRSMLSTIKVSKHKDR
jgi:hypothetical protein